MSNFGKASAEHQAVSPLTVLHTSNILVADARKHTEKHSCGICGEFHFPDCSVSLVFVNFYPPFKIEWSQKLSPPS